MQQTRSLVTLIARAPLRTLRTTSTFTPYKASASASLHTTTLSADEEKRGFLSRLNPFAKTTPKEEVKASPAAAQEELNVEIEEEEAPIPSWKSERKELSAEELEESIRTAAAPFVNTAEGTHLNKIQLDNPKIKFQVMKAIAVQTGHEIPNKDIASIHTLKDVLTTLHAIDNASKDTPENPKGHVVAEWFQKNQATLPANMVFIPYAKAKGVKIEDRKRTNKRFL